MIRHFYLPIDETLIGTTTSGPKGLGDTGNEEALNIS